MQTETFFFLGSKIFQAYISFIVFENLEIDYVVIKDRNIL